MRIGKTEVVLLQGDITDQEVDVIVNAANAGLLGGGGVDGAIHRVGGSSIMEECKNKYRGCPTGQAVITGAGNLKAKWVVHAVGPRWNNGLSGEEDLLRSAYVNSLQKAKEAGAKSVAFPSISTGVYGYPVNKAAVVALSAIRDFVQNNIEFEEIHFVLFSEQDLRAYQSAAQSLGLM